MGTETVFKLECGAIPPLRAGMMNRAVASRLPVNGAPAGTVGGFAGIVLQRKQALTQRLPISHSARRSSPNGTGGSLVAARAREDWAKSQPDSRLPIARPERATRRWCCGNKGRLGVSPRIFPHDAPRTEREFARAQRRPGLPRD